MREFPDWANLHATLMQASPSIVTGAQRSQVGRLAGPKEKTLQVASTLGDHEQRNAGEPFLAPAGLRGVPWFSGCTEAELAQVAGLCERLAIEEGEVILREGRLGRELFVILSGRATVTRAGTVVNSLRAGDYFGEL